MTPLWSFLTARKMNTRLAKRLKKSFKAAAKEKQKAFDEEQEAKKGQTPEKGNEHLSDLDRPNGVLAKDGKYQSRGPAYVRAHESGQGGDLRGGVYKPIKNRIDLKRLVALAEKAEFYNALQATNFNKRHGQAYPYIWEAHHMLPGSAFYYCGSDKKPAFTNEQIAAILRSDYNVNDGHNVIMLPAENWAVPVHELPQHPSDHVRYTQRVMKDMKEVADSLDKVKDTKKKHDKPEARISGKLKNLENDYWTFLVELGKALVSKVKGVEEFGPDDEQFVGFGKKYKYGRLY
jgi:hypothetical protein